MKTNRYEVRRYSGKYSGKIHVVVRIAESAISAIESVVDQYCPYDARIRIRLTDASTRGAEGAYGDYSAGEGTDRRIYISATKID